MSEKHNCNSHRECVGSGSEGTDWRCKRCGSHWTEKCTSSGLILSDSNIKYSGESSLCQSLEK